MKQVGFEWDTIKSAVNQKKHGVSFDEAQTVFNDPNARLISDPDHSDDEDRFVLMGMSEHLRILVVCHCYRENDSQIRIISARRANRKETVSYKDYLP